VLTYTATLANGEDLPAWLAFDAATRTFTGTPPGGGDDCGCGDEGGVDSLDIRVRAADLAGASAFDDFTLAIAGGGGGGGGMTIIGTDGDDTLAGTPCDDIIDGRKGFDVMRGGAGNDTYFVDETCLPRHKGNEGVGNGEDPPPPGHDHNQNDGPGTGPGNPGSQGGSHHHDDDDCDDHGHQGMECKVDQVIENAGAGYDIVYASADYTLPSNVEEVRLLGSADLDATGNSADNVLVGNKGDNRLRGGSGADVYVHQLYGGDDVIEEGGGSPDALLFGEGINADMVRLERRRDDLVVDLAGPHGKVTVKGWFASSSKRVERIQFADGTAWNEQDIRERTRGAGSYGHGDYHGYSHLDRDERAYRSHSAGEKRDDKEPASRKDDFVRDGYSRRWGFDFEETVAALAAGARSLTREEVAAGWRAVARYAHSLGADEAGADGAGLTGAPLAGTGSAPAAMRFGYEGSTAAPRGQDMLRTLEGLMEGFRNL
jgi:Ca2+-binding RTX toxin-like protein